ncbi:hypothetical protein LXT21_44080 [Myxococcus sp. K38C18041901]|uniref:hypothetical protein n=1 Tax=Myxococcus guangdongensis TaxID=2906760 RepID=UPI0020A7344F|nr:hypothetical protein [Myxococcus guangdongensis]MCP3065768.1 hypothetical protein [Myxococcus guangdongensis]
MSGTISARFSGFCGRCKQGWAPGDDITRDASTEKWVHAECPRPAPKPEKKAPAPLPPLVLADVAPLTSSGALEASEAMGLADALLAGQGMGLLGGDGLSLNYKGLRIICPLPATEAQVRAAAAALVVEVESYRTRQTAEATPPLAAPAVERERAARRHDALYNEGVAGGGYNPYRKADNEVRADELELDGRVVAVGGGRRLTVTGLRAPTLEGTARELTEGREVRALEVRAVLADLLAQSAKLTALPESELLAIVAGLEAVLAREETRAGSWWMHRRPRRDEPLGISIRQEVRAAVRLDAQPPGHLHVKLEAL